MREGSKQCPYIPELEGSGDPSTAVAAGRSGMGDIPCLFRFEESLFVRIEHLVRIGPHEVHGSLRKESIPSVVTAQRLLGTH